MVNKSETEEEIYYAALEEPPAERSAYLKAACGDDLGLLERVESLLKIRESPNNFLESPPFIEPPLMNTLPEEKLGTTIDKYKLLEKIGEGGMAVVYMAEQAEPIRRKVALKIIKLGMDTKQVIARFEVERQALAMMDHPNIAKVLDAGATETGRPYFVMELVTGVSITEYCDKNNLSTKERLALFIQVCNAVQHAHQKGIIHRDIKPSNVMVTHRDGEPIPKIIDFGIAKATRQRLTEKTLFTRYAHIIGTPAYMSPEQAELSDLDIDTRSDIYSLGVLLYELLTGTPPFSEEQLRKAGYIEMQRIIREEEPTKPSTKLSTLGDTLTDVAKHRSSTPDLLRRAIRGDLDWIVMKSLEKDRTRRYETADSLMEDIRRHLANEPVLARAPGTIYRLSKLLRRRRSEALAGLALVVVLVVVGVIISRWIHDRQQLGEAEALRDQGILSQAREQYAKAERDSALETLAPILRSKHVGSEAQLLYAGILVDVRRSEEAATMLGNFLDDDPEIAGAAHSLLARILWESQSADAKRLQEIEEHRRQAEALLPETAEAHFLRAITAVTVKEQLASLGRALQLDPKHYESRRLRAFTHYASRKYERMQDDALAMTILREGDPLGYSLRAVAWRELGRYPEAIADYDRAIELTVKDSNEYIDLSDQRIETLLTMGDYNRVIADVEQCLEFSGDSPILRFRLFCGLTAVGEYDKAAGLSRQIIKPSHEARGQFQEWCMKYVFDALEAGQSWHPADRQPAGAAFLPMLEAEETYRHLSSKAKRMVTDGFSADWSPDGTKLAFSVGVHGYSGVAILDTTTNETELLIVPGKDPKWSPDGKYIAFVRDCQFLRVSEFIAIAAERRTQHRVLADEEVWLMKSDGTEPRRLARGGRPSWTQDSKCIYYQSRVENRLCSISIDVGTAEPKQIMACSNAYPSVSPDSRRVAYLEGSFLKIKELASQALVGKQPVPFDTWGGPGWSPTGRELCIGGRTNSNDRTGLWIYSLDHSEPLRVLGGQITAGSWAPDGTKLAFCLGPPYFEIWAANLDGNVSTVEALGPPQTLSEHFQEMFAFHTGRIEANPEDAGNHFLRAQFYDRWGDRASANADMRQWSAVLTRRDRRRVINLPFDCELVFSAERPVDTIPMMSVAFGQKGRCRMKLFKIPMFVTSMFGLCLVSGLDAPPVYADFVFGEPTNLGSPVNTSYLEGAMCISPDGLELYFNTPRPGGSGDQDLWVTRRATNYDDWGEPVNLGATVNSAGADWAPGMSADGLQLYFTSGRPGGSGGEDIWVTTRETTEDDWGPPENLGPTVNSSADDVGARMSVDGLSLFFTSNRPGGAGNLDVWVTTRARKDQPWGQPENLGPPVNSSADDCAGSISPDGLQLYFSEWAVIRPGGHGGHDMWVATRPTKDAPWEQVANLGPSVNTPAGEIGPSISLDGSALYFTSNRPGGHGAWDIWQAPIIPIVDFNGDGKVDHIDLGFMMLYWGTDDSRYDIGPTPFGDGIVDSKDLMVLAEHGAMLCGDVNFDGVVDLLDLAELSKNWLQDNNP